MPITEVEFFKGYQEVKGCFVGGCVVRGDGSSFRRQAHAHTGGSHQGWICIRAAKRLESKSLLIHELAHILTGEGHTDKWRAKCLELGMLPTSDYFTKKRIRGPRHKHVWVEHPSAQVTRWCPSCGLHMYV